MWGVSLGVYQGLNNLYMVRLVGVHNLAPMLGSRNLMVAFGFTTVGPLLGKHNTQNLKRLSNFPQLFDSASFEYRCIASLRFLCLLKYSVFPSRRASGVVRDASGSYAVSCWVVAGLIAVSFILWLLMPAAVAYDKRRKEKAEKQAVSLSV